MVTGFKFMLVGAIGFAVQIATLWLLTSVAHWPWPAATIVAVECAIVHNFVWHSRWTFGRLADRSAEAFALRRTGRSVKVFALQRMVSPSEREGFSRAIRFAKFNLSTGLTSILGNVALMSVLVGALRVTPVLANIIAVGLMSLANWLLADRWIFARRSWPRLACVVLVSSLPADASAAPSADMLAAWTKYVAAAETRLDQCLASGSDARSGRVLADGRTIDVGTATVSDWCGSVLIRGVTLDELLQRLQHPGTPPPQEDIVAARVLGRAPDTLRVYIRLLRHAIVTVTYDTEHEMVFHRETPSLATARSIATRIDEVGGGDHGFLWRLNSYWRYEQVGAGVLVSLQSLSLSRDVPMLIKPIAGRIVPRIARESMVRTLEALQQFFAGH